MRKEVTYVKKLILPVICAVVLFFVINAINPKIEMTGIVMVSCVGLVLGSLLNKVVFKKK